METEKSKFPQYGTHFRHTTRILGKTKSLILMYLIDEAGVSMRKSKSEVFNVSLKSLSEETAGSRNYIRKPIQELADSKFISIKSIDDKGITLSVNIDYINSLMYIHNISDLPTKKILETAANSGDFDTLAKYGVKFKLEYDDEQKMELKSDSNIIKALNDASVSLLNHGGCPVGVTDLHSRVQGCTVELGNMHSRVEPCTVEGGSVHSRVQGNTQDMHSTVQGCTPELSFSLNKSEINKDNVKIKVNNAISLFIESNIEAVKEYITEEEFNSVIKKTTDACLKNVNENIPNSENCKCLSDSELRNMVHSRVQGCTVECRGALFSRVPCTVECTPCTIFEEINKKIQLECTSNNNIITNNKRMMRPCNGKENENEINVNDKNDNEEDKFSDNKIINNNDNDKNIKTINNNQTDKENSQLNKKYISEQNNENDTKGNETDCDGQSSAQINNKINRGLGKEEDDEPIPDFIPRERIEYSEEEKRSLYEESVGIEGVDRENEPDWEDVPKSIDWANVGLPGVRHHELNWEEIKEQKNFPMFTKEETDRIILEFDYCLNSATKMLINRVWKITTEYIYNYEVQPEGITIVDADDPAGHLVPELCFEPDVVKMAWEEVSEMIEDKKADVNGVMMEVNAKPITYHQALQIVDWDCKKLYSGRYYIVNRERFRNVEAGQVPRIDKVGYSRAEKRLLREENREFQHNMSVTSKTDEGFGSLTPIEKAEYYYLTQLYDYDEEIDNFIGANKNNFTKWDMDKVFVKASELYKISREDFDSVFSRQLERDGSMFPAPIPFSARKTEIWNALHSYTSVLTYTKSDIKTPANPNGTAGREVEPENKNILGVEVI